MTTTTNARLSAFAALLRTLGQPVPPLGGLRHAFGGQAPSATDIVRYARRIDLKARVAHVRQDRLMAAPLPAIAVLRDGAFVLLLRAAADRVLLLDPQTQQPRVQPRSDFDAGWSGDLIFITRRASLGDLARRFDIGWFFGAVHKYRWILAEVLVVSLFLQVLGLMSPLFFQVVIDKVLVHRGLATLDVIVVGLVAIAVFEATLGALRTYLFAHTTNRIDVELGARLFRHLLALPLPYFQVRRVGDSVARVVARRAEQLAKLASLEQQIAEKQAEAEENTATIAKLKASLPLLQQKRDLYRSLLNVQSVSRVAWLDAEQASVEGEHDLDIQLLHSGEVEAARQSLLRQAAQQGASYAHDLLKDLADARQHADELAQQYAAAAHKAEQTVLTAPIDGTVQQLAIHTVGGVVTPAQALLTVVPDDAPVLVEATVANDDIGFVRTGQPVEIKVKTFSFTRYGLLHGHVVDISRDAVPQVQPARKPRDEHDSTDDADASSDTPDTRGYVAHVALDRTTLDVDGHEQALEPGMEITAEIKTGRRRVISYLLSPLQRYAHEGLGER
jgi:HlyD family type I secretion membrane fusion protein